MINVEPISSGRHDQLEELQSDYVVALVPTEQIEWIWGSLRQHFEEAVERSHGRWTMGHLLKALLSQDHMAWVVYRKPETESGPLDVVAALTTQVVQYPGTSKLAIQFMGGTGFGEWAEQLQNTLISYGKDCGCSGIENCGRFGFWPQIKKLGYEREYAIYEIEFEENDHV